MLSKIPASKADVEQQAPPSTSEASKHEIIEDTTSDKSKNINGSNDKRISPLTVPLVLAQKLLEPTRLQISFHCSGTVAHETNEHGCRGYQFGIKGVSIYTQDVSDLVEAWADSTSFSIQSTLRFQFQFCPTKEEALQRRYPARVAKCHSLNMSCSLKTCCCATGRCAAKLPKLTCKVQPWLFADAPGQCLRISQSNGMSCPRGGNVLTSLRA